MAYLVLVRHGQSEWNAKGLWTGLIDITLSAKGHREAREAAKQLHDINFDVAYTSTLKRAQQTLQDILTGLSEENITLYKDSALNERDYGIYTGKNKWEIKKNLGEEKFLQIRRSWDHPIAEGESLKDVYARVVPYYKEHILKDLKAGKNVLVAAHGNSLRALVKYLENISALDIPKLNIATGEIYIYQINKEGAIKNKEIRKEHLAKQ